MANSGITTAQVRQINRSKVFQAIYRERDISKQALAQTLNMSLPTVSHNLLELQDMNLVEKSGLYQSTGGRKAQVIRIVQTARIAIGVEILKKLVHIVAVDLYGNALKEDTLELCFSNSERYFQEFGCFANRFVLDLPYDREQILGIAIATQGLLSPDGESVVYGKIMNNLGVCREQFAQVLAYPCFLVHDSKAAAYAEIWHREDIVVAVVILLNRNLGGALVLGGTVHEGNHKHSGTVEHMCIVPGGKQCYCGKKGCFEAYCSGDSLRAASGLKHKVFFQRLRSGDQDCVKLWKEYLRHLAFTIDNVRMVTDIDVVLSGFLSPYLEQEDVEELYRLLQELSAFAVAQGTLKLGQFGPYPAARGAALYYIEQFLSGI